MLNLTDALIDDAISQAFSDQDEIIPESERWTCDTLDRAVYASDKLRVLLDRQEEIDRAGRQRIAEATRATERWMAREQARLQGAVDWWMGNLRAYHDRQREALGAEKVKTLHLPTLRLEYRKQPDVWERDTASLLAYVQTTGHPEFVKTTLSLDWSGMKKALSPTDEGTVVLKATGEEVPGITVTPGEETWKIARETPSATPEVDG